MTSITAAISSAYQSIPLFPNLKLRKPADMAKKLTAIAIPAILFLGAQSVQVAEGFTSCIVCVCCLAAANPGCLIPCVICGVTIPAPLF